MENKRIVKKSLLYLIGNFSSKVLSSLLVPIYAFYVSTSSLGNYDYYLTIINIVSPLLFVSIWEAILRYILTEKNKDSNIINTCTAVGFSLVVGLGICIFGLLSYFITLDIVCIYFSLMLLFTSFSQVWQSFSRAFKHNNIYIFSSVVGTAVNLILNIIFICYFRMEVFGLFISYIGSQMTIFIILESNLKILKNLKLKLFNKSLLINMIKYSFPLVINSIAIWLINGFGKIIIMNFLGADANGLYSFANKFVTLLSTLGSVISMALTEESLIFLNKENLGTEYSSISNMVFRFFISIIFVALPALSIFYSFLGNTDYYSSLYLLPIMLFYSIYMNMSTNIGIAFKVLNITRYQFITTFIGSAITIVFSLSLVNSLGIYGVIIGQAIGAFSMFITRYFYVKKYVEFPLKILQSTSLMILFLISSIFVFKFNLVMNIVVLTIFLLLSLFFNKELLFSFRKNS